MNRKKHITVRRILISILLTVIIIAIPIILYFYKHHSVVQPEDSHLNGDGVYFNIFTKRTRGKSITGTFKNINHDTILYASIQNIGKNRHMKLTAYLDYHEIPLNILSKKYDSDNIYLKDGDNIIIPFKLNSKISSDENHKLLVSLFWGTDLHESNIQLKTNNYSLSYDFFIQNLQNTNYHLGIETTPVYFCNYDFPSVMINTDFNKNTPGANEPSSEIKVKANSNINLAYRIGKIKPANNQLLLVTMNYHQTKINNADYLLINTQDSKTAYGTFTIKAPSKKGLYEICAVVVTDPTKPNNFVPLENAYRFTLNVT